MMASKTPMQNKQLVDYTDKWIVSRSALYAEVEGVQIGCTHLSTRIPLPYTGEHGDIPGQQRYELNTLLDHMDDKENGQTQIMLGDFNTGPDGPSVDAEYGENYELIPEAGWYNENVASGDPFCTWCVDENFLVEDDGSPTSSIDHIVVRNGGIEDTRRIFDEIFNVGPPGGPFIPMLMSDHFGVRATIVYDP